MVAFGQSGRRAVLVTGRTVPVRIEPRRPGKNVRLIADSTRAREELGWRPRYAELHDIVKHAWRFAAAMQRSPGDHGVAGTVAVEVA